MYTQFFGNYLLNKGLITSDQLFEAMKEKEHIHTKLGTLAIHTGFLTAKEVEQLCILQTHIDKLFGELAVSQGLLTNSQLDHLLFLQQPDFLTMAQALLDKGYLKTEDFEYAIVDYQSEYELTDLDFSLEHQENLKNMIEHFYSFLQDSSSFFFDYLALLFNNLIRFIGEDFTPYPAQKIEAYPTTHCIYQTLHGETDKIFTAIDMDEATFIGLASRYASESFTENDDFVSASIEDFLNLHNGLFAVNMSNEHAAELGLEPPLYEKDYMIDIASPVYYLPIKYPFGTMNILLSQI